MSIGRGRKAESVTLRQGWKPNSGFYYGWEGYNEATLLYVLAMASSHHAILSGASKGGRQPINGKTFTILRCLYGGPLFMHQFSHAWTDFAGIATVSCGKRSDYFENSRRSTLLHREYARRNPHDFKGYGDDLWGLSACDGPGGFRAQVDGQGIAFRRPRGGDHRRLFRARCPFRGGTTAQSRHGRSSPLFAPEICLSALRHLIGHYQVLQWWH